jgi:hypothetical protein
VVIATGVTGGVPRTITVGGITTSSFQGFPTTPTGTDSTSGYNWVAIGV